MITVKITDNGHSTLFDGVVYIPEFYRSIFARYS